MVYERSTRIDGQVHDLRKRQVIGGLKSKLRDGAYWINWSETADFGLSDPLDCPDDSTKEPAAVPTRLGNGLTQRRLVNRAYAVCGTARRTHVLPGTARPGDYPYPGVGV
jgi:NTE family protein